MLPKARFEDAGDVCIKMRRVKTKEELALTQRAYDYFSRIHAFARDYVLEHGTDLTDFKVGMAATEFGTDLILKDVKRDGHPHNAVGIEVSIGCRSGVGTAYPHPNQFHHNPIHKGDSFQARAAGFGLHDKAGYKTAASPSLRHHTKISLANRAVSI